VATRRKLPPPGPAGTRVVAFTLNGGKSNAQVAREFGEELRLKLAALTAEQASVVQRKLALAFLANVLPATPVDKGRARGGWQLEVGRVPNFVPRLDPAGSTGLAEANNTLTTYESWIRSGYDPEIVWIGNNVPYIEVLNSGLKAQKRGKNAGRLIPYSARGSRFFERGLNYVRALARQLR